MSLAAFAACASDESAPSGVAAMPCANGIAAGPNGCDVAAAGAAGSTGLAGHGAAGAPAAGSGAAGARTVAAGSGGGSGAAAGSGGMAGGTSSGGAPGSAGSAAAGSGSTDLETCGEAGMISPASNASGAPGGGRGGGNVNFTLSEGNQITRLVTTLEVPKEPNGSQTLFLWPGLEPIQGEGFNPIGLGVLQPVLTWGGSCAPGSPQSRTGDHWWISAQYVNVYGNDPEHEGCHGGDVLPVEIGDQLLIDMNLQGTVWNQTVTSGMSKKMVDFDIDMENQPQRWALFIIEMPTSSEPSGDVVFTNTVMTFEKPEPEACKYSARGANDYVSAQVASADGTKCCVSRIVLRAPGVMATSMDPPP